MLYELEVPPQAISLSMDAGQNSETDQTRQLQASHVLAPDRACIERDLSATMVDLPRVRIHRFALMFGRKPLGNGVTRGDSLGG